MLCCETSLILSSSTGKEILNPKLPKHDPFAPGPVDLSIPIVKTFQLGHPWASPWTGRWQSIQGARQGAIL